MALETCLTLNIADGDEMRATHVGRIRIKKSIDGIRWEQRFWDDVYYAEGMSDSLFSIAYMETKKGYSFFFGNGKMRMMNDNNIIFGGERKGSVYVPYLRVMTPSGHASKAVSTAVLHQRFGHVNDSLIRLMEKNNLVEGLVVGQGKRDVCDSCFLGKMTISSHPTRDRRPCLPGERFHTDVCHVGVVSWNQCRYFMTMKDESSGYRFVFFLKD